MDHNLPEFLLTFAIKRSFAVGKIWIKKSARLRNLLIAVIFSRWGLTFSATISEAEKIKVEKKTDQ